MVHTRKIRRPLQRLRSLSVVNEDATTTTTYTTIYLSRSVTHVENAHFELELELIQTQMAQKPMLRAEVGMRVRCANKASAE